MLKERVRRAFDDASAEYAAAADVQRQVAESLFDRLALAAVPTRVLDAGCGTGLSTSLFAGRWPQAAVIGLDFAPGMLQRLPAGAAWPVCGDIEHMPLRDACVDLAWASLSLQWCALPRALAEMRRVLRPGGTLAFATLASDTFHELRSAFAGIDGHSHTLAFLAPEVVEDAVRAAGFAEVSLARERLEAGYPDLPTLLRSIKRVGASEVTGERRRGLLGRQAWASVEAEYARFCRGSVYPLTYDVLTITAKK